MNVYDFDKTIYKGDSTFEFYLFCLRKEFHLLGYIPLQFVGIIKYVCGIYDKTEFKEHFYCFLKGIKDIDLLLSEFWELNNAKIAQWYIYQKKADDIIISASPEFLLKPICDKIGITVLIASRVNKKTGKYTGKNCYGGEKVNRYREMMKNSTVESFYSDSLSDAPFAMIASNSYVVIKNQILAWNEYKPSRIQNIKLSFLSKEFLMFLIIGCINIFNGILFAFMFSLIVDANTAFICGYMISLLGSYLLTSALAFKEKFTFRKYAKFCISYIPNFIIQNVCVLVFYNWLTLDKLVAYALSAIIGIPITFLMVRFFAFAKK